MDATAAQGVLNLSPTYEELMIVNCVYCECLPPSYPAPLTVGFANVDWVVSTFIAMVCGHRSHLMCGLLNTETAHTDLSLYHHHR